MQHTQFDLPYIRILRVKEFKFREVLGHRPISEERDTDRERSVDNLMQVRMGRWCAMTQLAALSHSLTHHHTLH